MLTIQNFAEAQAILTALVPLSKHITGKDITLERMKIIMSALGNPQKKLRIIHLAGTSGKSSTAYYLASLLDLASSKVGLTVSPHVANIRERIQLNLRPISEDEFCRVLEAVLRQLRLSEVKPTYFELLIAMVYWHFMQSEVEYAVIETGMGGSQDATNVADNQNKFCVITDIGMDHMHVLGNTVTEIARQKAGIIHKGNTVIMYKQSDEINRVISDRCEEVGAELILLNESVLAAKAHAFISKLPDFQQRNWLIAYEAFKILAETDKSLSLLAGDAVIQSFNTHIPGRMEKIEANGKPVIIDGAHNEQKTKAFVGSFQVKYPGIKVPVMLSLKQGKEFAAVLPLLKPIVSKLVVTEFTSGQDTPTGPINAGELGKTAKKLGYDNVVIQPDVEEAYKALLQSDGEPAIVTGSFYLVGQVKELSS